METLDKVLATHARIRAPFDKTWKRQCAEFCAERLGDIQVFRALGLDAVKEPDRRRLIAETLGPMNGHDPEDYGFNVWLLNECIGERIMSHSTIFLRCLGCYKVRTSRSVAAGPCRCGGARLNNCIGPVETREVLVALVRGQ